MSAPIQPPRAMAVHLVGFLGLPWRIWGYLVGTLFFWGLMVLVFIPVGLLGKVICILVPFLGAVCLAWPRGGRHMDEWATLAWGYYRARQRATRQRARTLHPAPRSLLLERWESSARIHPPVDEAGWWEEADSLDSPLDAEELPAAEELENEGESDQVWAPSAGAFIGDPAQSPSPSPLLARTFAFQTLGSVPPSLFTVQPNSSRSPDVSWDEETGTCFDPSGDFLLDVGLAPALVDEALPWWSQPGRILPMPQPLPRKRVVGH